VWFALPSLRPYPKSSEFQRFSAITDPSYGEVLSPVYRATPTVWAQARTVSTLFETPTTLFETPTGIIASPTPVADKARQFGGVPKTPFENGYQDFDLPSGMRVWWSPATGAHAVGGGFVAAWVPQLGLALTDEVREGWSTKVTLRTRLHHAAAVGRLSGHVHLRRAGRAGQRSSPDCTSASTDF
jgi:hypothetical protein